ncbi:2-succinyl-5-enolpyruvyl-6-hydroxy-3-cyclohexene-1-carboxylic-acid synthase [Fodinibius saliphilus]|uniref:2-succinyl-5-enolpyruvyl-6-hydroxy-3- cyclohexene-1-carboxylic-acid synthase n=1 Tax=Fodinibius saliphilus TaxID=1920650 RepID=UPI0011096E9E|nr:2-succinyl-5-enolpyruvyl-6-hydroxy-3-cyclohexene-1-carboxylic-acid synthase [Fodinibius saliphilus]
MTSSNPGNLVFNWTATFFRTLQQLGVQHVIISPGSRSTPLTLAAATNKHFQKHVILDERSAAFTALGIGKATNTPAVLICTSGTAVANYYPAVIEARKSGVPIILATADRPPNRRATGANQAIDQLKIFGDYPVFFHEVGEAGNSEEDLERLEILGQQAFEASKNKRGPVHLNFPFRKPLEPDPKYLQTISTPDKKEQPDSDKTTYKETQHLSDGLLNKISKAQNPLIIVGPLAPGDNTDSIRAIAEKINAPIIAESNIDSKHVIKQFSGFLRNEQNLENLAPDLILRFGFQPTAKSIEIGLEQWNPVYHYHFASTHALQNATLSEISSIPWFGRPIATDKIHSKNSDQWLNKWKETKSDYQEYANKQITEESPLTDGHVYDHLTPQLTRDLFLMVSNSFPARDINLFGKQPTGIPLYLNRGTSGIDGITSTAFGLSLALDKAGVLITGDLAFLHDSNALLNQQKLKLPLVIIVINNSGGSIFRMLPIEQHEKYFTDYFETPQSVDIRQMVQAHDIPFHSIETFSELHDFSLQRWMRNSNNNGLSIIECKTDADASMKLRKKLWKYS